jgi:hypothetical protein
MVPTAWIPEASLGQGRLATSHTLGRKKSQTRRQKKTKASRANQVVVVPLPSRPRAIALSTTVLPVLGRVAVERKDHALMRMQMRICWRRGRRGYAPIGCCRL